jgi:glycosyltransferase involved in cell wall biosynthesis
MKLGLVVNGGVDRSGRERVTPALVWLIQRLARRHDVHVFALHYYREPCTYPLVGATVHDVGRVDGPRGLRRWRLAVRLDRAIARVGVFDLLHAYQGMPAGVVAATVAAARRLPLILTFDSGELVAIGDIGYGLQRRWIDRRAIDVALYRAWRVTVCTGFMARLPALHGRPVDEVPIGIDTAQFPLAVRSDGPPWRLLRVASLNAVKDYPTLLQAMRRVVDRVPQVHLDIVGEDTLHGTIQSLARALNLSSNVAFLGFQPTDQLAPLYGRAHLHVVSSRHEAAAVAVLEAAATGLPTVGTRAGYVADWETDRAAAVPAGDPDALADSIIALLQDPERRARLAARARSWTLAHDADWTAQRFEELYAEATRLRPRQPPG